MLMEPGLGPTGRRIRLRCLNCGHQTPGWTVRQGLLNAVLRPLPTGQHPAVERGWHETGQPRLEAGNRVIVQDHGIARTEHDLRAESPGSAKRPHLEIPDREG